MKSQKIFYPLLLFFSVFFVLLPWIFFDVDIGDQGYTSAISWLLAFDKRPLGTPDFWHDSTPLWFGLYLNSLWWRVVGPSAPLLMLRLGWILMNAGTALALFFIFKSYYEEKKIFVALFITALLVNCAADDFLITYNCISPALGAICFALFASSYSRKNFWPRTLFAVGSGFFAVLAIQSKLPCLPFVGIFFVCSLLLEIRAKSPLKIILLRYVALATGFFFGLCFTLGALYSTNQWEMYFPGFKNFFVAAALDTDNRYEKSYIIQRVLGHYQKIAIGTLILSIFVLLISRAGRWKTTMFCILLVLFGILVGEKYGVALSMLLGAPLLLHGLKFYQEKKLPSLHKLVFLGGGILVLVAFTFGTNLEGVQNYKFAFWIWFSFAYLEVDNFKSKWIDTNLTKRFLIISACLLFLITRLQWPTFPYLERPIFAMNSPFQTDYLRGIFSYKEKQEALDGLSAELERRGLKMGDALLAYSGGPPLYPVALIYSMTRTIPLFHNPTLIEYPGYKWPTHRKILLEMAASGTLPRWIVRQKKGFPGHPMGWRTFFQQVPSTPNEAFYWTTKAENGLAGDLDEILQSSGYKPIWENIHFVILER